MKKKVSLLPVNGTRSVPVTIQFSHLMYDADLHQGGAMNTISVVYPAVTIRNVFDFLKQALLPIGIYSALVVFGFHIISEMTVWAGWIGLALFTPLQFVLVAGFYYGFFKLIDTGKIVADDFFGFSWMTVLHLYLYGLVWMILCTIGGMIIALPGIFFMVITTLGLPYLIDKNAPFWEAMIESVKMVIKVFGNHLVLLLKMMIPVLIVYIPAFIVIILQVFKQKYHGYHRGYNPWAFEGFYRSPDPLAYLSMFFSIPFINAAMAIVYRKLKPAYDTWQHSKNSFAYSPASAEYSTPTQEGPAPSTTATTPSAENATTNAEYNGETTEKPPAGATAPTEEVTTASGTTPYHELVNNTTILEQLKPSPEELVRIKMECDSGRITSFVELLSFLDQLRKK